jgi:1,4-alpha-glucan branching enzyme
MVLNHSFGQSPFVQLYLDYYGTDQIFMKMPNPWFNASSPNPLYKWGADFNHQSLATQKLVDRVTSYWLTEYKIDGFRFDFTKGFTNTPGDGGGYDASRISILKRMSDKVWSINPGAYVILEHFAAATEDKELAEYGMMLWGNNNYNYGEAAMGYPSDLTGASSLGRGWGVPNLVSYMESHDEERLMFKTINYGSIAGNYSTKNIKIALKRMELNALFFLTIPGPKMIWQFGELGYDISIDFGGRTSEKPLKWDYFLDTDRHKLFVIYKLLNNLKKNKPAFGTDNYTYSLNNPMKSIQLLHSSMNVTILGNFGLTAGTISPGFPNSGKWYEYFTQDSITVAGVNDPINLQPGEYRLYTTKKLESPKYLLGIKSLEASHNHFVTVYPNPSVYEFFFEIENKYPAPVILTVFDMLGKVVRQIKTGISSNDIQLVTWDGKSSNGTISKSGIYLVEVNCGLRRETVKIIKNK